jgi:hypothetical protein
MIGAVRRSLVWSDLALIAEPAVELVLGLVAAILSLPMLLLLAWLGPDDDDVYGESGVA